MIAEEQGKVYILYEPLTLAELEQVKKRQLKKIRINNQVRKVIRGALGGLKLFQPDTEQRLQAAAVFKLPQADLLPVLEKSLKTRNRSCGASPNDYGTGCHTLINCPRAGNAHCRRSHPYR